MSEPIYIGQAIKLPLLHCPNCGHRIDGATPISETDELRIVPQPGAYTFCCYCGEALVFEETVASVCAVKVRLMTPAEVIARRSSRLFRAVADATRKLVESKRVRGRG